MNKKLLIALLCLMAYGKSFATHLASAEIRYEYTGSGDDYRFYLTLLKVCEPGNVNLSTTETINVSSGCTAPTTLLVSQISVDTISLYCPGTMGSCAVPTSIYPAYERRVYTGITSLAVHCADWKFSWSNCCRNAGIVNLTSPLMYATYIESTLDNTNAMNTSSWYPNPSPFLIPANTNTTIPFHTVDAENDSIAFEWATPLNQSLDPIPYVTGYSLTSPLGAGSILVLDPVAQTLTVNAPNSGKYALSIIIKEYRNGQLTGTTMRDFTIVAIAGSTAQTIPMPVTGTTLHYVTCPGLSQSITLNFMDSTATDSVFLSVGTPVIPGFSFTATTVPGQGTASATISWNTPASFNPATLPQFYFSILAHDNSCPAVASAYYAVAIQTAQCNTDSVWAGDANGDYTVNIYDPLAIAVAYGTSDAARPSATTAWQAEYCTDWSSNFYNGVNMKHADCDGNGTVDNADLGAVSSNWGMVHLKPGAQAKTTGFPDLYFDIAGVSFIPGSTVSIPIVLGNPSLIMNYLYGLATTINIGGITLNTPATVSYPQSWLGSSSNTLSLTKPINGSSDLAWAYARTDHQNVNGQGILAMLNLTIPADATGQITLEFTGTELIDTDMTTLAGFNTVDATATIEPTGLGQAAANMNYAYVVPNPSSEKAAIQIMLQKPSEVDLTITDVTGKIISRQVVDAGAGENNIVLPATSVSSGVYFIRVENNHISHTIKWIKQ